MSDATSINSNASSSTRLSGDASGNNSLWALVGFLAACYGVSAISGLITVENVKTWYPTINKPEWTPPSAVFGPVWGTLYGMMAVAAWLVWREKDKKENEVKNALRLFWVQLALNFAWSGLFFGMRRVDWGLWDILALWIAIVTTLIAFWRIKPLAGILMLPYLLWVSFATALNFSIWRLN